MPQPPLLPADADGRARVRGLAYAIACDVHPLNNLRVLKYLKRMLGQADEQILAWQQHWMAAGFAALENLLAESAETGRYCHGDEPTIADVCLIPQMANARRVNLDLSPYPTLARIESYALAHPAFEAAKPANQPDAE